MDIYANIAVGRCLADIRRRHGLTQCQLAERLGKPQSFVSKIEGGERCLRTYELFDYAKGLEVSATELVGLIGQALDA